jgi:disulfide bond formation protein DsbB
MPSPNGLFHSPRQLFVVPIAIGLGLVGGGVVMAQMLGLAACPLCIIQRMLYLLLAAIALPGLMVGRGGRVVVALLLAATAAAGVFVAGYQVWIQRFAQEVNCSANQPWWERLVDWAGERAPLLFEANGLCSDPAWKFLSLSIADWSLLIFSGLFLFSLYALLRQRSPA